VGEYAHPTRLRKYGDVPTGKTIMCMMGIDVGPARSPLPRFTREQLSTLRRELGRMDIFTRPLR
jgi:hypothetical protein